MTITWSTPPATGGTVTWMTGPNTLRDRADRIFQNYAALPIYCAMLEREGVEGPAISPSLAAKSRWRTSCDNWPN